MHGQFLLYLSAVVVAIRLATATAGAAEYAGEYQNDKLHVVLTYASRGNTGEIQMGKRHFSLTAREEADHLAGTFVSEGTSFEFNARLADRGYHRRGRRTAKADGRASDQMKRLLDSHDRIISKRT